MSKIPEILDLNNISEKVACDLFICSSSFEDRCLSIPKHLDKSKIVESLVLYNEDSYESITKNKDELTEILGDNVTAIKTSSSNPLIIADSLMEFLSEKPMLKSILLDITCFSHEHLLIILKLFHEQFHDINISCIYINAGEYCLGKKKSDKWLSRGIGEIRTVLGYPGNILTNSISKMHLVLISGYEYDRANAIISALEPSYISLGYGMPDDATVETFKEANEEYTKLVEQMAPTYAQHRCFNVCCDNPYKAKQDIEKELSSVSDHNIVLVAMNNKISTVGVALVAIANDDIQICYAPALLYNIEAYASPGTKCYLFPLIWE